ncbi:PTCB-BRCT domain-containing protein [Cephalotus follicularis]|uniref:PTCB-BRCT domain-containing protein n=1 Tax=Cephalotus follicularis TaxID=3775 RepID=A0A1Q3CKR2_CEPFO|nr:PTCB-BRCT domain-containing protein [Cephalotus follicularis]
MDGGGGRVEVIDSKGCSKPSMFRGLQQKKGRPSLRSLDSVMSPSSSSASDSLLPLTPPFSGLVICVTGLSKEARKQVMEATERLGGHYSPHLHPHCTHLVVQSFSGRKFEHALQHGSRNGLFVVSLGWFVDSARKNVRLSESLYSIKSIIENVMHLDELDLLTGFNGSDNSCLPAGICEAKQLDMIGTHPRFSATESPKSMDSALAGQTLYVDSEISAEMHKKVFESASRVGARFVNQWFVGCKASYVVCEGSSIEKYLGHSNNLVTPLWVLKTAKEKYAQRLVHVSTDLARQIGTMIENFHSHNAVEEINGVNFPQYAQSLRIKASHVERQQVVNSAKIGVRNRRGCYMQQTCQTPIRTITPSCLLESICWSISDPTSTISIYTDSFSAEDASEHRTSVFFDAKGVGKDLEAAFANLTRPLTESEKAELIFKNHFITILFPIDRFSEMGPSSRTFFSNNGFTCLQLVDHIYAFYQEKMPHLEIEAAIHTDSRHADRLRSVYSSKEVAEQGHIIFKRIDFLGSRKSFEMLKRVSGNNSGNVYELLIRA